MDNDSLYSLSSHVVSDSTQQQPYWPIHRTTAFTVQLHTTHYPPHIHPFITQSPQVALCPLSSTPHLHTPHCATVGYDSPPPTSGTNPFLPVSHPLSPCHVKLPFHIIGVGLPADHPSIPAHLHAPVAAACRELESTGSRCNAHLSLVYTAPDTVEQSWRA